MSEKKVLVLGGGVSGLSAALDLAAGGCRVYLAEKEKDLGGNAARYGCKATINCQKCGACFVAQKINAVLDNPSIEVHCGLTLQDVQKGSGVFNLSFNNGGPETVNFSVNAVVAATGFKPFDAATRPEYGYGLYDGIMTAFDLEEKLQQEGVENVIPSGVNKIAFIQCVGSRSDAPGENYCCRVGCMYAVRLAKLLRHHRPEMQIDIYYMDLQNFGKGFKEFKQACIEEDNINFILGRPGKVYGYPGKGLLLKHESPLTGEQVERPYDRVFLSISSRPGEDTGPVANLLGLEKDEDGFFKNADVFGGYRLPEGIFVAGACAGPKDIAAAIRDGKGAAGAVLAYLG